MCRTGIDTFGSGEVVEVLGVNLASTPQRCYLDGKAFDPQKALSREAWGLEFTPGLSGIILSRRISERDFPRKGCCANGCPPEPVDSIVGADQ